MSLVWSTIYECTLSSLDIISSCFPRVLFTVSTLSMFTSLKQTPSTAAKYSPLIVCRLRRTYWTSSCSCLMVVSTRLSKAGFVLYKFFLMMLKLSVNIFMRHSDSMLTLSSEFNSLLFVAKSSSITWTWSMICRLSARDAYS